MKISTAEIKILIVERVKTPGMYTNDDFKQFIIQKSGKTPTKNQIAGAISQLVETGDIVRVGRGLYSKSIEISYSDKDNSYTNGKEDSLKKEIYNVMDKIEEELVNTMNSVNIFELNSENFEIIKEMRELRENIEEIKNQCN